MQEEYFKHLLKNKAFLLKVSLFFAIFGLVVSLFLNNYFRASSIIVPTRDNYQNENSSQIGAIAQSIGFGADDATPELKFALSYFNSYKFISEFIASEDILPEILFFKGYNRKKDSISFSVDPDEYRIKALFDDQEVNYSSKLFQDAVKEFRKFVILTPGRENDPAMYLSVTHRSPSFAYRLNKKILLFLNEAIINIDIKDSDSKLDYIKSIIPSYDEVEVRKVLSKIIEKELTKKILANSVSEYSFMILDPPVLPIEKYSPRRTILILTFMLSGLLVAIIYQTFTFAKNRKEKYEITD